MQAHVLSHFAELPYPSFPFLCLTVSGGHTQIIKVTDHLDMTILGETIDDAAGEAFDKAGKMLGLPYPAGPQVDKLASQGVPSFPFPKSKVGGLQFSFSGLKTSILYFLRDEMKANPNFIKENLEDLCASIQHTIIDMLMSKLKKAAEETGISQVSIAGGVSANSGLRKAVEQAAQELGWDHYIPAFEYCRDNAAMIGVVGYQKYLRGEFSDQSLTAKARMPL